MEIAVRDLGEITNAEVLAQFVNLDGLQVIDAGCGAMTFTKILADQGANVIAIDPDPIQAEKNRNADEVQGIEFIEAGADQLPVEDGSVDGVFFSYSLHHIPAGLYPQVFAEVLRVLKPGGFLYVIEPVDCPLNQVMRLFHDEDNARADAQVALRELAVPEFEFCEVVTYHGYSVYETFEDFFSYFAAKSFNTIYSEADIRRDEVKNKYEENRGEGGKFASPRQVMVLKQVKSNQ